MPAAVVVAVREASTFAIEERGDERVARLVRVARKPLLLLALDKRQIVRAWVHAGEIVQLALSLAEQLRQTFYLLSLSVSISAHRKNEAGYSGNNGLAAERFTSSGVSRSFARRCGTLTTL